ncbi:uncharacterized protein N7515_005637 [Penicillium bovifimosum]|uniref:Uncharacterized protein n=1 Tax=Penicillium bovifimosum TaxID=126998 RepID=A0A9W9GTG4_9EURO|nr:uncharacterized protein N7515_005637 [Penicillium bovifimosum]KAJ5129598.1 hypothetical protein N7515_005637 [Penicillium bovifimosum]
MHQYHAGQHRSPEEGLNLPALVFSSQGSMDTSRYGPSPWRHPAAGSARFRTIVRTIRSQINRKVLQDTRLE